MSSYTHPLPIPPVPAVPVLLHLAGPLALVCGAHVGDADAAVVVVVVSDVLEPAGEVVALQHGDVLSLLLGPVEVADPPGGDVPEGAPLPVVVGGAGQCQVLALLQGHRRLRRVLRDGPRPRRRRRQQRRKQQQQRLHLGYVNVCDSLPTMNRNECLGLLPDPPSLSTLRVRYALLFFAKRRESLSFSPG